jgi:hypothetical protein
LFENYLEEIFLWILKGTYKWNKIRLSNEIKFNKKIKNKWIKKIILWEKNWNYLDWIPYKEKTEKRAKRFFLEGKPFTDITQNQNEILNEILILRNYIAHKSIESKKILENNYSFKVLSIHYLLTKNHSWNETYFDKYINHLINISLSLQSDLSQWT